MTGGLPQENGIGQQPEVKEGAQGQWKRRGAGVLRFGGRVRDRGGGGRHMVRRLHAAVKGNYHEWHTLCTTGVMQSLDMWIGSLGRQP